MSHYRWIMLGAVIGAMLLLSPVASEADPIRVTEGTVVFSAGESFFSEWDITGEQGLTNRFISDDIVPLEACVFAACTAGTRITWRRPANVGGPPDGPAPLAFRGRAVLGDVGFESIDGPVILAPSLREPFSVTSLFSVAGSLRIFTRGGEFEAFETAGSGTSIFHFAPALARGYNCRPRRIAVREQRPYARAFNVAAL
jgi:hypothetical protein